jgi:nucleotide-binding universal stress UspA family protein
MDLKRILVAVNSLSDREAAFERALALAQSSGAELYVLHAVPVNHPFSHGATERLARMTDVRKRAEEVGVRVQVVEQHGDPAEIIELHANARAADLVVLGAEPSRGWRRRSSVAERVIRRTKVPTLVVASDASDTPTAFRHVLVAVDLAPASREVLRTAIALTADEAAQLTVAHTVKAIEAAAAVQSPARWTVPEYRAHVLDDARATLESVASAVPASVNTRVELSTGSAARAILEHAADTNADLIVMGRSRGFKALGSTALRVLRKSDRALFVVPSDATRSNRFERQLAA